MNLLIPSIPEIELVENLGQFDEAFGNRLWTAFKNYGFAVVLGYNDVMYPDGLARKINSVVKKKLGMPDINLIPNIEEKKLTGVVRGKHQRGLVFQRVEHSDDCNFAVTNNYPNVSFWVKISHPDSSHQWVLIPHKPNSFVVNVGDILAETSKGVLVSAPHKFIVEERLDQVTFFYY